MKTLKEITRISNKLGNRKVKRPQSPRNPYRGRAYIPPKLVPCLSLEDAHSKLKSMGFTEGRSTANFWQDTDGRTAVVQEPFDSTESYQLYIRGNQPDQI